MQKRRKSKDGLWLRGDTYWTTIKGQRQSTGCKDREAARLVRKRLERQAADPTYQAATRATLGVAVRDAIEDRRRAGRSKATLEIYEAKLSPFIRIWGPGLPLSEITVERVQDYISKREKEGGAKTGSSLSPHTIHKELRHLRFVLKSEKAAGRYPHDVGSVTKAGRFSPQYEPRDRFLPWAEIPLLLAQLPAYRAAHVAFILATGCRMAESEKAERTDVTWLGDVGGYLVRIRGTKTKRARRTIPIARPFWPLIEAALRDAPGEAPLFKSWENVNRTLKIACERAGIDRVSPNDLRRTNASLLRQAGVRNEDLALLLGHASTRMVDWVYGKTDLDSLTEAVSRVAVGEGYPALIPPTPAGTPTAPALLCGLTIPDNLERDLGGSRPPPSSPHQALAETHDRGPAARPPMDLVPKVEAESPHLAGENGPMANLPCLPPPMGAASGPLEDNLFVTAEAQGSKTDPKAPSGVNNDAGFTRRGTGVRNPPRLQGFAQEKQSSLVQGVQLSPAESPTVQHTGSTMADPALLLDAYARAIGLAAARGLRVFHPEWRLTGPRARVALDEPVTAEDIERDLAPKAGGWR